MLIKVSKIIYPLIYPLDIRAPKYTQQTVMDIQTEYNVRASGNHITPFCNGFPDRKATKKH